MGKVRSSTIKVSIQICDNGIPLDVSPPYRRNIDRQITSTAKSNLALPPSFDRPYTRVPAAKLADRPPYDGTRLSVSLSTKAQQTNNIEFNSSATSCQSPPLFSAGALGSEAGGKRCASSIEAARLQLKEQHAETTYQLCLASELKTNLIDSSITVGITGAFSRKAGREGGASLRGGGPITVTKQTPVISASIFDPKIDLIQSNTSRLK